MCFPTSEQSLEVYMKHFKLKLLNEQNEFNLLSLILDELFLSALLMFNPMYPYNIPSHYTFHFPSYDFFNFSVSLGRQMVLKQIIDEVREAVGYTIIADEVTAYNKQLMSICIRYVTKELKVTDQFLDFKPVDDIRGETLFEEISSFMIENNLPMENCLGQAYYGASNMSGKVKDSIHEL